MPEGKVYLCGAGPGDPGLLTLRARECLEQADALYAGPDCDPRLLRPAAPGCVRFELRERFETGACGDAEFLRQLRELARRGSRVVCLFADDPFFNPAGAALAGELAREKIPFEIVPGIAAAIAGPAHAGIPATHRGTASAVALIRLDARREDEFNRLDWPALAALGGTLVFQLRGIAARRVLEKLLAGGLAQSTPVALITRPTLPDQRTRHGTAADLLHCVETEHPRLRSVLVAGRVADLHPTLRWFENRPLFGRRLLVVRSRSRDSRLALRLEELGARVEDLRTLKILPLENPAALMDGLRQCAAGDWLLFTSANSAIFFLESLWNNGLDARALSHLRLAAIGAASANVLDAYGLRPEVDPGHYQPERMLEAFVARGALAGQCVRLIGSNRPPAGLIAALQAAGARVETIAAYRLELERPENFAAVESALEAGEFDCAAFTNSNSVRNFGRLCGAEQAARLLRKTRPASIGPSTTAALRELGLEPAIVPETPSLEHLVVEILKVLGR